MPFFFEYGIIKKIFYHDLFFFLKGSFLMNDLIKEYAFKSTSGLCNMFVESYVPDPEVEIKGIVQISHGMAEHQSRYAPFARFLNTNGYVVFINDHLGHGKSIANYDELGYFGKRDGYIYLIDDMKKVNDIAREQYPGLPVILFGHSMGSFLSRFYVEKYGNTVDGAIFCGTSGANPAVDMGLAVIKAVTAAKGDHYRSQLINKLAFGSYNKRIKPARTDFDWLSTNKENVDKYIADPLCGFLFTTNGYRDLLKLLKVINRLEWYTSVRLDLPMLLISGEEDPVGNYGKGVKQVCDGLKDSKHENVEMKLYPGDRHEILNEQDRLDVYNDVLDWINKTLKK